MQTQLALCNWTLTVVCCAYDDVHETCGCLEANLLSLNWCIKLCTPQFLILCLRIYRRQVLILVLIQDQ